jgi:uncharacterized membrane protein
MKDRIIGLLQDVPLDLQVFILSLLPVTELKAAIPYGIMQGMSPLEVFLIAVSSEVLLIVVLLTGLPILDRLLCCFSWTRYCYEYMVTRVHKHQEVVERYGHWGLFIFVAVPFPGTGVWSGALLAFVLGLPFRRSFIPITLGLLVTAVLVVIASLGLKAVAALEGGLGIVLFAVAAVLMLWKLRKSRRK